MSLEILENVMANRPSIIFGISSNAIYRVVPGTWHECQTCNTDSYNCAHLKVAGIALDTLKKHDNLCVKAKYMEEGYEGHPLD